MCKKLLYFCILLFSSVALASGPRVVVDGNPQVSGDVTVFGDIFSEIKDLLYGQFTTTTEDFTIYVRSTGSDTADGLSSSSAMLTVQAALTRIPRNVQHAVTLDIGEGNFAGFTVNNFVFAYSGYLTIQGTLGAYSPATGTASGTATAGSTTTLTDAGQAWTVNDLRGTLLLVNGEYRIVRTNDATSITVIGAYSATTNGKAYSIVEQKTIINSASSLYTSSRVSTFDNYGERDSIIINDIGTTGGTYAWFFRGLGPTLNRVKSTGGATVGFAYQNVNKEYKFYDLYVNGAYYGLYLLRTSAGPFESKRIYLYNTSGPGSIYQGVNQANCTDYFYIDNPGGTSGGLVVYYSPYACFTNLTVDSANDSGVLVQGNTYVLFNTATITNSGDEGLYLVSNGYVEVNTATVTGSSDDGVRVLGTLYAVINGLTSSSNTGCGMNILVNSSVYSGGSWTLDSNTTNGICLSESGRFVDGSTSTVGTNTSWGIYMEEATMARIKSTCAVTGGSGDLTINGGTTALSYASEFSSNGDRVINPDENITVHRQD